MPVEVIVPVRCSKCRINTTTSIASSVMVSLMQKLLVGWRGDGWRGGRGEKMGVGICVKEGMNVGAVEYHLCIMVASVVQHLLTS